MVTRGEFHDQERPDPFGYRRALRCGIYFAHAEASARGTDANNKPTEMPSVMFTGNGDVSVRFAAESSPRLAKWWNGRIVVDCPTGYSLKVIPGTGSPHSGLQHDQGTCEPNLK